jgi:hypothetical protein
MKLVVGGRYKFKYQPKVIVYTGNARGWHQFNLEVEDPKWGGGTWCELQETDLHMIEEAEPVDIRLMKMPEEVCLTEATYVGNPSFSYLKGDLGEQSWIPFLPRYGEAERIHNSECCVCPFCGAGNEPDHYEDAGKIECGECGKTFSFEASFGYGYSTKPVTCAHGQHIFIMTKQYLHEGDHTRVGTCLVCEKLMGRVSQKRKFTLPWLVQYNNPSYFDPEGVLNPRGFDSFEEMVYVRHEEQANCSGSLTPILDALYNNNVHKAIRIMKEKERKDGC